MRHEMLTQHPLFCHCANTKRGMLSQHFMMHVVPPLSLISNDEYDYSCSQQSWPIHANQLPFHC